MNKKILVTLGVLIVLGLGITFPRSNPVIQQVVGAFPGPDIDSKYLKVNGATQWYNRVAVRTATTTLCSIKTPAATSTIAHFSVVLNTTASYPTQYLLGHDTAANNATTTSLGGVMGAYANKKLVYVASSTVNDLFVGTTDYGAVPPNTYINFNLSTSTAGASATYAPSGYCTAIFTEL